MSSGPSKSVVKAQLFDSNRQTFVVSFEGNRLASALRSKNRIPLPCPLFHYRARQRCSVLFQKMHSNLIRELHRREDALEGFVMLRRASAVIAEQLLLSFKSTERGEEKSAK